MITLGARGYFLGGVEEKWSNEPATSFAHDVWDEISHQTGFWGLDDVYFDSWWSGAHEVPGWRSSDTDFCSVYN